MRVAEFALAASLVAGCAGTQFKWEDTEKIHNGMTEAEVIATLGQPYTRTQVNGATSMMTWSFAGPFGSGARAITYRFVDGRVVASTTVGK